MGLDIEGREKKMEDVAVVCAHHWVLEDQVVQAHGVCKLCGEEKVFSGGHPEAFGTPGTQQLVAPKDDSYGWKGRYARRDPGQGSIPR